jgi:hypothetical protein
VRRLKASWAAAWPAWSVAIFASLALARLLPSGYIRAVVAAPILLGVPGSITLAALFGPRSRPRSAAFVCGALLLGCIWSALTSLALYVLGIPITAGTTYLGLLIVCVVGGTIAQTRMWLERTGEGRRVAHEPAAPDFDYPDDDVEPSKSRARRRASGGGVPAMAAIAFGTCLLVGAVYAYDHLPHPTPAGYTYMAWSGAPITGVLSVGPAGINLPFQVVDRQPGHGSFTLTAAWLGDPPRSLARPLNITLSTGQVYRAALHVPPLPDGCTYRIVVTLSLTPASGGPHSTLRSWSIDADVHDPGKSTKTCT